MTWRTSSWTGKLRWLSGLLVAIFAGLMVMIWFTEHDEREKWFGLVSMGMVGVMLLSSHTWLELRDRELRLGYFPLYRRTIAYQDIAAIRRVKISPLAEYGGTGIKGLAASPKGILLGGYPTDALRIETVDNKRYVLTLYDRERIISALQVRGCTLADDQGD